MNTVEKSLEFMKPKATFGNTLKFTAYSYAKLLHMQSAGKTEVAGYCVTETEDPLLVTDFILIKQECSVIDFDFDKDDMAEYQERMLDRGLAVWQSSRILAHTHPPGCSPDPSITDEKNFENAFTRPDWAIMLIVADDGKIYCRLKTNVGPGMEKLLNVEVDFMEHFSGDDKEGWDAEYELKVKEVSSIFMVDQKGIKERLDPFHRHGHIRDDRWDSLSYEEKTELGLDDEIGDDEDDEGDFQWDEECAVYLDEEEDTYYSYNPVENQWYEEVDGQGSMSRINTPNEIWVEPMLMYAQRQLVMVGI